MKKSLIFLMLGTLSLPVWADSALNYNLINLSASASVEVSNDQVSSQLQISFSGNDTAKLAQQVNQKSNEALTLIKNYADVKVQTGSYSTQPTYRDGKITGWQVSQFLQLKSQNFEQFSELLAKLQNLGNVQSMQFSISDVRLAETREALTKEAISNFRNQATLIQQQFEQPGYRLVSLSVNRDGYAVRPYMQRAMMMADSASAKVESVAVEAGTNEVTVDVSGQIQLITDPAVLN